MWNPNELQKKDIFSNITYMKVKEIIDVLEKTNEKTISLNDRIFESLRYIANYKFQNKYMKLNLNQAKQEYGAFKFKFVRSSMIKLPLNI